MGKAKYILLDCDNTLVQSERVAFEACAELTNEVLEKHGLSDRYTASQLLHDFVGFNFRGMLKGLQQKHNFTMEDAELEDFVEQELGRVTMKLSQKAVECPGVTTELNKLKEQGYPMSVVSTSAKSRVVASIEKAKLDHFFPNEHVYSAATSLDPPSSKPDPAVYLYACKQLGVKPEECVTVEDSKSGATAAMRANIPCIAYVGIYGIEEGDEKMEEMAHLLKTETKCKAVMYRWEQFQDCLKQVEEQM
ncbi:HAD-superfamily hydrolase-like protein [Massariosphaeria phaeospora]|uniref:HAD-superfamily hydrolase-like protein n=1 Tax=Massariosphaeria phaeospora TaxID=100035 RepID=A0A7C8HZL0_9PLEO|nr:HAD-superfamily hydrolase-like protein [Massariosphaeria phaeospora]